MKKQLTFRYLCLLLCSLMWTQSMLAQSTCTGTTPANPGARTGSNFTGNTINPTTAQVHWVSGSPGAAVFSWPASTATAAVVVLKNFNTVTTAGAMTIQAGSTLYVEAGATLNVTGALTVNGTLINLGRINVNGTLQLAGSSSSVYNNGVIIGTGMLHFNTGASSFTYLNGGTSQFGQVYYQVTSASAVCLRPGSIFNIISSAYASPVTGPPVSLPAGGLFKYHSTDITGNPTCSTPNPARINYYSGYVPSTGFIYGPSGGLFSSNSNIVIVGSSPASSNTGSSVLVTSGTGYSASAPQNFNLTTHSPVPTLVKGNYLTFCRGSFVPLAGLVSGTNLMWYTTETGGTGTSTTPTINTSSSGLQTYWISQNVTGSCEGPRTPLFINIDNNFLGLSMDIYSTLTTGCTGDNLGLYTLSGVANSSFNWWGPNNFSSTTPIAVTVSANATSAMTGTYYVMSIPALTSCYVGNSIDIVISSTTPPTAPTAVAGSSITCTQFTAAWSAITGPSGATAYELDVSTSPTFASFVGGYNGLNVGNVTTYNITGLSANTIYYYRVRALNGCGLGANSNTITTTTLGTVAIPTIQPGSNATACQITANWSAAANATSYLLYVSTVSNFTTTVSGYNGLNVGNVTTYNVTGLNASTTYYYRVRATNVCGTSGNSGFATYATTAAVTVPTAAAATGILCNQFTANWAAAANATSYILDVSTVSNFTSFVSGYNALNVGNVTSYNVTGLASSTGYFYRVRATNGCTISGNSGNINPTTLGAPGVVTLNAGSSAGCTQFTANWTAVSDAASYQLDVATTSTFTAGTFVTGFNSLAIGNVVTYNVTGLTANTTYYYRVRAVNTCGTAGANVVTPITISTTAALTAPVATAGSNALCTQITANWNTVAGAVSYRLDVATANTFGGTILASYNNLNVGNVLTYNVTGLTPGTTYYYRVRVVNSCGSSSASSNTISFAAAATPVITTPPVAVTVCSGNSATFSVVATGASTYQWRKGGVNIVGATSSSYTIPVTVIADAGSYDVVIATAVGCTVTSSAVALTVNQTPAISQLPSTANLIANYRFSGNANDQTNTNHGVLQNTPVLVTDRAGIANSAYSFDGISQHITTSIQYNNPSTFSLSLWFKTTTTTGGNMLSFGTAQTGVSGTHDRHVYMDNNGKVYFGVHPGVVRTITNNGVYNDGAWHNVVATLSPANGMRLYIDGILVSSDPTTTTAENSIGYWRIAYDNVGGWTNSPTSNYFAGSLDDILIYNTELTATQAASLYTGADGASSNSPVCEGGTLNLTATTIAGAGYAWTGPNSFSSSTQNPNVTSMTPAKTGVYAVAVTGANGCVARASTVVTLNTTLAGLSQIPTSGLLSRYSFSGNANDQQAVNHGLLQNGPVLTTDRFGTANSAYTFNGTTQHITTSTQYVNPSNFTVSVWINTTTVTGGNIISFGNAQTGGSSSHDRHVYMSNDGKIYFGVYPNAVRTIESAFSYNDGNWHLVTASLSSTNGIKLYVDGVLVASDATTTTAENTTGYWRIAYDNVGGWTNSPTSNYFSGKLDDILIYNRELTGTEVTRLYNNPDGAGSNSPVCVGSALSLTAPTIAGVTYGWTGPNSYSSSTQNPTVTSSAALTHAGTYILTVTQGSCIYRSYAMVNVIAPPTINTQPATQTVCVGSSVTFTVAATGSFMTYQWKKNGANISGATSASYTIATTVAGDAANYTVSISNNACTITSNIAVLTINTTPAITTQPVAQTTCVGSTATFSVVATGTNLTYQWSKNGVAIGSANAASYTTPATVIGDNGATFSVMVSNIGCTSATSNTVGLTVNIAPVISTHPANQTVCVGGTATFSVATSAGTNLTYQWKRAGVNVGTSVNSYTTPATVAGDNGVLYSVVVSSAGCASANSNNATLTVNTAPVISTQPTDQTVCVGGTATFSVATSAGTNLTYQWKRAGVNVGTSVNSYTTPATVAGDNGVLYSVVVSSAGCASATSNNATLIVYTAPSITTHPSSQSICLGNSVTFSVVATGTSLTYQWRNAGVNIGGANSASYNIAAVSIGDAASYDVVVGNAYCTSAISNAALLTVSTTSQWSGTTNNDWFTASNWSCNVVPNATLDAVIPSLLTTYPVISGNTNAVAKNIDIASGASLTMNGFVSLLEVYGNWTNTGTFNAGTGKVEFKGSATQTISNQSATTKEKFYRLSINKTSGSVVISSTSSVDIIAGGTVHIISGQFDLNSRAFTLKSAPNQTLNDGIRNHSLDSTARLGIVTGTLTNASNFAIERYIFAPTVKPRMIATPIKNMQAAQWADSVSIFGGDFRSLPGFPASTSTLYWYNEQLSQGTLTKGFTAITTKASVLTVGRGYRVIVGYDNNPTYTNPAKPAITLKMRGVPHIGGLTVPVTKSGTDPYGWNMLGNPYPCEINWFDFYNDNQASISATVAILDPKSSGTSDYYYYNAFTNTAIDPRYSVGTQPSNFGVTPRFNVGVIASSQAFYVFKTSAGNGTVSFSESHKVINPVMTVSNFRTAEATTQKLNIVAVTNTGYSDNTYVFFSEDATAAGFDRQYDAYKFSNTNVSIMTNTFGKDMAMNGVESKSTDIYIPLIISAKATGTHTLEIRDIESLNAGKEVYLIDHYTNTTVLVNPTNNQYSFAFVSGDTASTSRYRFVLKVATEATVTGVQNTVKTGAMSIYPNPTSAEVTISLSDAVNDSYRIEIIDSRGKLVYEDQIMVSGGVVGINDVGAFLSAGVYTVKISNSTHSYIDKLIYIK